MKRRPGVVNSAWKDVGDAPIAERRPYLAPSRSPTPPAAPAECTNARRHIRLGAVIEVIRSALPTGTSRSWRASALGEPAGHRRGLAEKGRLAGPDVPRADILWAINHPTGRLGRERLTPSSTSSCRPPPRQPSPHADRAAAPPRPFASQAGLLPAGAAAGRLRPSGDGTAAHRPVVSRRSHHRRLREEDDELRAEEPSRKETLSSRHGGGLSGSPSAARVAVEVPGRIDPQVNAG